MKAEEAVEAAAEEEMEEEYEEIYVDEDGRIIEDIEEYEIIEEEEIEVEEEEEEEPEEIVEEEPVVEEEIEVTVESAEVEGEVEIQVEPELEAVPGSPEPEVVLEPPPEPEAIPELPPEPEAVPEPPIEPVTEPEPIPEPVTVEEEVEVAEVTIETPGPDIVVIENTDAIKMAKDIVFEALATDDIDDIIASEIEQASDEEIDTALQAIGSDEAHPIANESDHTEEIDSESLLELETILGPLERSVGGSGMVSEDEDDEDDSYLPLNGDTLAELERLLETKEDEERTE